MLSRVAESIYWMARYIERAENIARFIDVTLNLILDQPDEALGQWQPLVSITADEEYFRENYGVATEESVTRFLTFDRQYSNSIVSVLSTARENARSVREAISSESWELLNEFYHFVLNAENTVQRSQSPSEFFRQIKQYSHLFNGVTDSTMSHGKGWNFANLGRMLERADKTSRILDVKYFTLLPDVADVGTPVDDLQWSSVLQSVSGFEMYRKRHHGITIHRVVDFLMLDRSFPRAIQYCIIQADNSLHEISGVPIDSYRNTAEQLLGRLRADLAFCDVEEIINTGLHQSIDDLQCRLNQIGAAIHDTFFALRPVDAGEATVEQ